MDLTAKERQGRGLDALVTGLRGFVETSMAAAIPGPDWVAVYESRESTRLGRPYGFSLDDPRQVLRLLRYERPAFPGIDASQRAWLEELIQSANRAAHVTSVSEAEADRALDTMLLLARSFQLGRSLDLDGVIAQLITLRLGGSGPTTPVTAAVATATPADGRPAAAPTVAEPVANSAAADGPFRPQTGDLPAGVRAVGVRVAGVEAVLHHQEAVNLALTHNGVSPLRALRVTNTTAGPVRVYGIEVQLAAPPEAGELAVATPLALAVGVLAPGETFEAQTADLAVLLNPALFLRLDEAVSTSLRLTVTAGADSSDGGGSGEPSTASGQGPIRLLTADEWWAAGIPELLAAFVRPNEPAIAQLLAGAAELLAARTGSSSLEGYQSGAGRVREIAEAVFDALAARRLTYVEPPASFEGTGQRIRSHAQVLTDGMGTCLDLACLYAAALEQAGLHPVLAVFEGHALTGYLNEDEQLPTVVVADQPTAITIADSDFFDAVEVTVVCSPDPSYEQARQATSHWWTADIGQLRFLLDVHAAHHRVRPLPTMRMDGAIRVVEVQDRTWSAPDRPPSRTGPRPTPSAPPVDKPGRIQRWERALLDMTYANPLLKRKAAGSLAVHVPSGALGVFEDRIAAGESFRLRANDEIDQIHRAQGARTAAEVDPVSLRAILEREHTLFVAAPERDLVRRLKSLSRRSKTALEESGSDNLYLTLGSLEWTDGGRQGAAPLFLIPIRLSGGRGVTPFSISLDESRERVPNYCLIEKVRTFGLALPALADPGEDLTGIDLDGALGAIRTAILQTRNTLGFHVEETADLALLQFSTLEMWQDLRSNWTQFVQRPAVDHLVHHPGSVFSDGVAPPQPQPTDEATTYLPIPADGSQIEAVRWAASGKTFILEGPPGTGKSQTITNLIADNIARGRTVLFVAEKAAALEVVRRRLDEIGLGAFSLDVHGRNQTVSAVRDQLRGALAEQAGSDPGWEPLQAAYAAVTGRLAEYPDRLHRPGPVGLSAWDARQLVLQQVELGTPESAALVVPRPVVLGDTALTDLYDWARQLGEALTDLGRRPSESPWRLSGPLDPANLPRAEIAAAVGELRDASQALAAYPEAAQLAAPLRTEDEYAALADWLMTVEAGAAWTPVAASGLVNPMWRDEADRRLAAIGTFRASLDAQLGAFAVAALDLPSGELLVRSQDADKRFFGKKRRRRDLLAELQPALRGSIELSQLTPALQQLDQLRRAYADLRGYVGQLPGLSLRPGWTPLDDRDVAWVDSSIRSLHAAARLRTLAGAHPGGLDLRELDTRAERLTVTQTAGVPRGAAEVRRWAQAWQRFGALLNVNPASLDGWLAGRSPTVAVAAEIGGWLADASGAALIELQRWARLLALLLRFSSLGMDDLVRRAYAGEIDRDEIEPAIRLGAAQAVLDERLATTGLAGFDEADQSRRIADFGIRMQTVRQRLPNQLRAQILAHRTFDPQSSVGQVAELRGELARRRSGRSVRRLLHDFGPLIAQITPCLLMSPQSVARFLPAGATYDLVVFDEASQIRVPESIGAIGRAQAAIIVGDSKQMPPTSMFAAAGDDAEESPEDAPEGVLVPADLESILSEAVESQFPRKLLSWHYRSRNEALIAFSNAHYYEGRLSSFPVAPEAAAVSPIELHTVAGRWEGGARGATRVNRVEAETVVSQIETLVAGGSTSIGVVTFNSQQRDLILDLLEAHPDPKIGELLQAEDDPVFVKNLENVQGDERDVIVFSLAFSPDDRGRIPLNWGPLTRAGGERRLNVAITRAKQRVIVVNSFDPATLDLSNSSSVGLSDLKDYLLTASASRTTRVRARRDAHLDDVAATLAGAGLEVLTQVGLSDFVVDLAVRTPGSPHWLALLLDGPAWASRLSVGDRETLPATVLSRMGWARVERIWLPTWLRNRSAVVESVRAAATALAALPEGPVDVEAAPAVPEPAVADPSPAASPAPVRGDAPAPSPPPPPAAAAPPPAPPSSQAAYRPASTDPRQQPGDLDQGSPRSRALIQREVADVVAAEAPVLEDRLLQLVAARFGLSRLHPARRAQLQQQLPPGAVRTSANGDRVVWGAIDPGTYEGFRVAADGERRDLLTVPYEELRNAMRQVARGAYGVDRDGLLRATANLFGVTRLTSVARPRLEAALDAALREGRLAERDGLIKLVDPI